ncbi:MAG: hypothetical protein HFH72_04530 [Lachnospiraceae bacterium]|nr:hypothetical protein [Lachnospiraceae bacterium]
MKKDAFVLEQAEFKGWKFCLSVNIRGEYDNRVRNPKVTVIFDSGKQKRRVPLVIKSYTEKNGVYLIYAQYTYDVRSLFYNEPLGSRITVSFDVMYGDDNYREHVPFRLGEIVHQKYDDSTEEEGTDDKEGDSDEEENGSGDYYDVVFSEEKGEIELCAKFKIEAPSLGKRILKGIKKGIGGVWKFILFLTGLCLVPVFLLDALLAAFGCAPKRGSIHASNKIIYILKHARWKLASFCRVNLGILPFKLKAMVLVNRLFSHFAVKKNQVVFLSNRRNDLSGNFEFIYNLIKDDKNLDIRFVLDNQSVRTMKFRNMLLLAKYFATSGVILVDDYMELLFKMPRREGTTLIQLWHACGAFKTFGCSRLGKPGGQTLKSPNHRNYDYATVSSKEIAKFYAEGFGLSPEKVVATGVPRTDIFFDEEYKAKVVNEFYGKYPKLREKKILLFAPTFRGNGKNSGYYPVELFDVNRLYEALGQEYAIIIKHHPFVGNRNQIQKEYKDYIIDLSMNSELNDLLFVTDVLVTDYSSVIFEASLLKIPMLFYVFDLEQYIATRGFYYEFETFVPGRIVVHFEEIAESILSGELGQEKLEAFRDRFFDGKDGKSSQRTVDLIYKSMNQ